MTLFHINLILWILQQILNLNDIEYQKDSAKTLLKGFKDLEFLFFSSYTHVDIQILSE